MNRAIIKFSTKLLVAIIILFSIHILVLWNLEYPLLKNRIIPSYLLNYILGVGIYSFIYKLRVKYLDILGFVYMGGSFLKFMIFLIFFFPFYRIDAEIDAFEMASFMFPYILCLFFETFFLIKLLNNKV